MKKYEFNAVSKIVLSFLLVISMILPYLAVVEAETTEAIDVGEAVNQFDPASAKKNVTVEGYIVGFAKSESSYSVEAETDLNIAIADTPGETNVKKMLYIQLPNSYRAEFGLQTNPSNLGKKIKVTGSLEKYFGNHAGLKTPTSIEFVGNDTTEPTQVANIKASPETGEVYAGSPVTLSTDTPNATIYYTTDDSDPSTASEVYEAAGIIVNEAMTIKAFATATGLNDSEIATFNFTIKEKPTVVSIAEARNKEIGQEVIVSGIVTAKLETATAHIQDEDGAAIAIYPVDSLTANVGDLVTVQGKVAEYSGLKQLTNITLVGQPVPSVIPEPFIIKSNEVAEDNESKLVTIKNVTITGSGQNFTGKDEAGTFAIYDKTKDSGLLNGKTYGEITGIVGQFTNYQLLPIRIIEDVTKVQDVKASHVGGVTAGTKITLSTKTEGATIYYTVDGSEPTTASTKYIEEILVNTPMTIKAIAVKADLTNSAIAEFEYEIINTENAKISDIQGASHTSPYVNLTVNGVEGIVTFVIDSSNFIMQEVNSKFDGKKSTAIKVNKSAHNVAVGDVIKVSGNVTEVGGKSRLTDTQITATTITKTGKDTVAIPEALVIGKDLIPPKKLLTTTASQFLIQKKMASIFGNQSSI